MNVHIAIFRWKAGTPEKVVVGALAKVKSLQDLVPDVTAIHVGENTSKWNQGYTHAVVVVGKSAEAIQQYRDHPVHVEVAAEIEAIEDDGIGIDFQDKS